MKIESYISKRFPIVDQWSKLDKKVLEAFAGSLQEKAPDDLIQKFDQSNKVITLKLLLILTDKAKGSTEQMLQELLSELRLVDEPKRLISDEYSLPAHIGAIEVLIFFLWKEESNPATLNIINELLNLLIPQTHLSIELFKQIHRLFLDPSNTQWIKSAERFIKEHSIPDEFWHQEFYIGARFSAFKLLFLGLNKNSSELAPLALSAARTTERFGESWQSPYISDNEAPLHTLMQLGFWNNEDLLNVAKLAVKHAPASAWQFRSDFGTPLELLLNNLIKNKSVSRKSQTLIKFLKETDLGTILIQPEQPFLARLLIEALFVKEPLLSIVIELAKYANPNIWAIDQAPLGCPTSHFLLEHWLYHMEGPEMISLLLQVVEKTKDIPQISELWKKNYLLLLIEAVVKNLNDSKIYDLADKAVLYTSPEGWGFLVNNRSALELLMQALAYNPSNKRLIALANKAMDTCIESSFWITRSSTKVDPNSPLINLLKAFYKNTYEPQLIGMIAQYLSYCPFPEFGDTIPPAKNSLRELFLKAVDIVHFTHFEQLFLTHQITFNELIGANPGFLKKACVELLAQLQNPELSHYTDSAFIKFILASVKEGSIGNTLKTELLHFLKNPKVPLASKHKTMFLLLEIKNNCPKLFPADSRVKLLEGIPKELHELYAESPADKIERLERALEQSREENKQLRHTNAQVSNELQEAKNSLVQKERDLKKQVSERKQAEATMSQVQRESNLTSKQKEELKRGLELSDGELKKTQDALVQKDNDLNKQVSERKQLESKLSQVQRESELMSKQKEELRRELDLSHEELQKKEDDLAQKENDLQKQLSERKQLESKLSQLQNEQGRVQQNIDEMLKLSATLKKQVDGLQVQVDQSEAKKEQMNERELYLKREVEALNSRLDVSKRTNQKMLGDLRLNNHKVKQLEGLIQSKNDAITELKATIQSHIYLVSDFERLLQSKDIKIVQLEKQASNLHSEVFRLQTENAKLCLALAQANDAKGLNETLEQTVWNKDYSGYYGSLSKYNYSSVWEHVQHEEINGVKLSWTLWMSLIGALVEVNSSHNQRVALLDFITSLIPGLSQDAWRPYKQDGEVTDFPLHLLITYIKQLAYENPPSTLLKQAVDAIDKTRHYSYSSQIWGYKSKAAYNGATAAELWDELIRKNVIGKEGHGSNSNGFFGPSASSLAPTGNGMKCSEHPIPYC